jgi:hypothetical protein
LTLFGYDDLHPSFITLLTSESERLDDGNITHKIQRFGHNLQLVVITCRMRVVNTSSLSFNSSSSNNNDMGNQQKSKVLGPPKIPRGLRRLPIASSSSTSSVRSEYDRLKAEAAQIEQWWSSPRWQDTKRVYSGTYYAMWKWLNLPSFLPECLPSCLDACLYDGAPRNLLFTFDDSDLLLLLFSH